MILTFYSSKQSLKKRSLTDFFCFVAKKKKKKSGQHNKTNYPLLMKTEYGAAFVKKSYWFVKLNGKRINFFLMPVVIL